MEQIGFEMEPKFGERERERKKREREKERESERERERERETFTSGWRVRGNIRESSKRFSQINSDDTRPSAEVVVSTPAHPPALRRNARREPASPLDC